MQRDYLLPLGSHLRARAKAADCQKTGRKLRAAFSLKQVGFTLIELLVVVGIIGVLLSLLLPHIREARRTAKVAVCVSNYRQVGSTLYTYANDYDGNLFRVAPNASWTWTYQAIYVPAVSDVFLPDILAPYSGGQSGGEFQSGGQWGNRTPGNLKNWNCPFTIAPPISAQKDGQLWLNQQQGRLMMMLNFSYSSLTGTQDWPLTRYNVRPSFPIKISAARSDLPMAQDLFTRCGGPAGDLVNWVINHTSEPNPWTDYANTLCTGNPSYQPNIAPKNVGFGATVLFYDGSARHVPANELVRVDAAYNNPTDGNANMSVLGN